MKIYKVTCIDWTEDDIDCAIVYEEYYQDRTDAEIERDRITDELEDDLDDYKIEIKEVEVF